jgi:hypothetical protein
MIYMQVKSVYIKTKGTNQVQYDRPAQIPGTR